jgi:hypothetical protein
MIQLGELCLPAAWLLLPCAHTAGVLSHRHRILGDLIGGERHSVLRLLVIKGSFVLVGVATHEEGTSGYVTQWRQDDLRAVKESDAIAQLLQTRRETVWRGKIRRLWHGGDSLVWWRHCLIGYSTPRARGR